MKILNWIAGRWVRMPSLPTTRAMEVYCDPASWWQISPDRSAAGAGPDGLLECVEDQAGAHAGGGAPAEDAAGVGVDQNAT